MDFRDDEGKIRLHSAIVNELPELARQPCHVPDKGTRSHVFIFENSVFKGPRNEAQAGYIQQEYKILQHIEGMNLPVPKVIHFGKNAVFFLV